MKYVQRPYQKLITDFGCRRARINVFAQMGLGKTVSILDYIKRRDLDRVLIIAPLRVCQDVWPAEIEKWDDFRSLEYAPILGEKNERRFNMLAPPRISLINFENVNWLVDEYQRDWPFTTVIVDEASRLKGLRSRQGAKRARALADIAHKKTYRWVNLTGTPASNGLQDLWGLQWFIDGGETLGTSYDAFMRRWFYRDVSASQYARPQPHMFAKQQIEEALKPSTIAVRTEDWFELEKVIERVIYVTLPPAARQAYDDMRRKLRAEVAEGSVTAANAGVKSAKLMQLASGFVYLESGGQRTAAITHDAKIQALRSIITETQGEKILVSYQYVADKTRMLKEFPQAVSIENVRAVDKWNEGSIEMLLAHPRSAGHGLNLQHGGRILVDYSAGWNLEEHDQILERIGPVRQFQAGYKRNVFRYSIVARNTIDEQILQRHATKRSTMDLLMEALS